MIPTMKRLNQQEERACAAKEFWPNKKVSTNSFVSCVIEFMNGCKKEGKEILKQ